MNIFKNDWDSPVSQERLQLVFEHRHQEYGAYRLRRDYSRTVLLAFLLTFGLAGLITSGPFLMNYLLPAPVKYIELGPEVILDPLLMTKPEKQEYFIEEKKETSMKSATETKANSEQFTNLKVSETDSSKMKTQDELSTTTVATTTHKTDSTNTNTEPLPITTGTNNTTSTFITWAQKMPEFPGGEADMMKYLKKNIRYPGQALAENITGTVYLSFIINTEGKVSQVKILKGIGGGCEEEAVRVVKSMPVWEPGKQNGNPVNVQLTLPVSFKTR